MTELTKKKLRILYRLSPDITAHARFVLPCWGGGYAYQILKIALTAYCRRTHRTCDQCIALKMQLSITGLAIALLCVSVACTTVQSLTVRGIGRVHHTTRELKEDEDKFVTDPSANVKGKFPLLLMIGLLYE